MGRKPETCWLRSGPLGAVLILIAAAFALPDVARAQEDCFDNAFCLEGVHDGEGQVSIRLRNLMPGAITMRLNMELENLSTDRQLPLVVTIPGARTIQPMRLTVSDLYDRWGYRFDAKWIMGTLSARHDDQETYGLPFDQGSTRLVGQGYNGTTTHRGKYALDFDMPEGTPIRAAREGVVVEIEDSFRIGGPDQSLKTRANFVKVQHNDGTIGNYVHLRHNGVRVRPGQRVRRGQVLGESGNTGFTTGPHLHFEVYAIGPALERQTIPVQFATEQGRVQLEEGQAYLNPAGGARRAPQPRTRGNGRGW